MSRQIGRPAARDHAAYFSAAYSLLGERGYDGLTIQALCSRVGVTKGAFYHQFQDLPTFVMMFSREWQTWICEHYNRFSAEPDPRRRLEVIANGSFIVMTPGVQAMRAWAQVNPAVAGAVSAVYHGAAAMTEATIASLAEDEDTGRVLSAMGLAMWGGIHLRARPLDLERFMQLVGVQYRTAGIPSDLFRAGNRTHLKILPQGRLQPVLTPPMPVQTHPPTMVPCPTANFWPGLGKQSGTRERYFAAAADLLGRHGPGALTIAALAQSLELTKGSFHHHFDCLPTFVEQFAQRWESAESIQIELFLAESNPLRRMELLLSDRLMGPSAIETAWRAWGQTNPVVRQSLLRVDGRLERAIAMTLEQVLGNINPTNLIPEMTLGLALGLHSWHPPLDRALTQRAAVEWMRRVIGLDAEVRTDSGAPVLAFSAA